MLLNEEPAIQKFCKAMYFDKSEDSDCSSETTGLNKLLYWIEQHVSVQLLYYQSR